MEDQDKENITKWLDKYFRFIASSSSTKNEPCTGGEQENYFKVILNPGRDEWPVPSPTVSKGQSRILTIEADILVTKLTFEFSIKIVPEIESIDLFVEDGTFPCKDEEMEFAVTVYYSVSIKVYGSIEMKDDMETFSLGPKLGSINRPSGTQGPAILDIGGGFAATFEDGDKMNFKFTSEGLVLVTDD